MRGKGAPISRPATTIRITPAYAGKSSTHWIMWRCRGDHPRVCGEKPRALLINATASGSPPRMRGKVPPPELLPVGLGITPAYAGKSANKHETHFLVKDHPRVCGEKSSRGRDDLLKLGSPPRMRGKDLDDWTDPSAPGITPAYAGKSDAACIHGAVVGDHPRVCGEKWPAALYEEMERGITPAYAGKRYFRCGYA